jgi:acetyl-CoA carboxylase carboxyltransferase component
VSRLVLLVLVLLLLLQVPKVTVIIGGSFGAGNYGELQSYPAAL